MVRTIPEIIQDAVPYYKNKGEPDSKQTIMYDSPSETLEPLYFYVIELMEELGYKPEKLIDNFDSSPGSGHFGELGQRATVMQQQGAKLLADINAVLRSVLNIIYDLKEFKIRLQAYDDLKSGDKTKKDSAILSLKQLWLDKVDIQKGNSGIKAMAFSQAGPFVTLIDAFLAARTEDDVDDLDLNDRVKRILKPRIHEFNSWVKNSEVELRKRYELEKNYLRSQVNSLKLYSRWAKPYLLAAQELEPGKINKRSPELVKTFNSILLELSLLGKNKLDVYDASVSGDLPLEFKDMKMRRDYYGCILVEFKFRGIPQKVSQQSHYTFGGKAEITISTYALNEDELEKIDEELKKSDVEDALELVEGATSDSLEKMQDEINYFLEEKTEKEETKETKDTSNPFLALLGFYDKSDKKKTETKKEKKKGSLQPDNWIESKHLRPVASANAKAMGFKLFDVYKKSHGMASFT